MVIISKWTDLNEGLVLSETSKANVIKALEIELSNAGFYLAAAKKAEEQGDDEARSIFKALAKVEAEHASTFKKILKPDIPSFNINEVAFSTVKENFEESLARETRAVEFYGQALDEAIETRTKQIFKALVEVEGDHLALDKERLG
jgi:rubrerythrin